MRKPVNIETPEDVKFINDLLEKMVEREERRREDAKLFSPSALADCLRLVYLSKNFKELEIKKLFSSRPQPNFYFLNGNFLHVKWQFALYKMDQAMDDDDFKLVAVEHPIVSKRGDHGGTVDVLIEVDREPLIVDFKGINVNDFNRIVRGELPHKYRIQCADYGMLYNASKDRKTRKIKRTLLVIENKGGPTEDFPIALAETEIPVSTNLPDVRTRLEVLRKHEQENSIPPPECISTKSLKFQGCPFRGFCKEEVKEIEKRRAANNRDTKKHRIAISKRRRSDRARRNKQH